MARQLNKAGEFIERLSKFYNGRKCRLKKVHSEEAVNVALEQVMEEAENKQEVMRLKSKGLYKVIELENLYDIINNLKL